MNYTVEPNGNIVLETTPKQAAIIAKALVSKNLMLRKEPVNMPVCNEILKMSVRLDEAMVESNKVVVKKLSSCIASEPGTLVKALPKPKGIWIRIRDFFNEPFTTRDYESSRTRSGDQFTLDLIIFEREFYPSKVCGMVNVGENDKQIVSWDQHGKCRDNTGTRLKDFDLVRSYQTERDSSLMMGIAVAGFILTLFFTNLTN